MSIEDVAETGVDRSGDFTGKILLDEVQALAGGTDGRIIGLIREGYSSTEIAGKLHLSKESVRKRWQRLKEKLQ